MMIVNRKGTLRRMELVQAALVAVIMSAVFLFFTEVSLLGSALGGLLFGLSWLLFGPSSSRIYFVYDQMMRLGDQVAKEAVTLAKREVPTDQAVVRLMGMTEGWREALLVAKRRLRNPKDPTAVRAAAFVKEAVQRTRWPQRLWAP